MFTRRLKGTLSTAVLLLACNDPGTHAGSLSAIASETSQTASAPRTVASAPKTPTNKPSTTAASTNSAASTATTPKPAPGPPTSSAESKKFAASSNAFGMDLYQKLRTKKGNLAVSPASLSIALAMTYGGASGDTATEMKKVLHLEGTNEEVMNGSGKLATELQSDTRRVKFRIANKLFGEKTYSFEKPFMDATERAYGAKLEAVDFKTGADAARGTINTWVEQQTEKRIKDLIPSGGLDQNTRLVLTNAVYFLGDWAHAFEKEDTKDGKFQTTKAASSTVPMMHQTSSFKLVSKDGVRVLELPYQGGAMSLLIVLPNEIEGLDAVEKKLDVAALSGWLKDMKAERVELTMPKFEIDPADALTIGDILQGMGMKTAFSRKADFTKIANPAKKDDQLMISQVFHKAFVKLDEKGTEAAAASAVAMATKGAAPAPAKAIEFVADHPFLFMLRDNTSELVVFMGRVSNPASK